MLSRKEVAFILLVIISSFAGHQYVQELRTKNIADFYTIIENQEKIKDDVPITPEDFSAIQQCGRVAKSSGASMEECARDFYDKYTMKHGGEAAFAHLARLQKEHPDLLPSCHYISHGIGHAVLRQNNNDPYKAFAFMQSGGYFKNVVTCGNGFFHGVIEEIAKKIKDKDQLVEVLGSVCANEKITNKGNCFHGIGHAAMIQTDYSIPDMLYICDRISPRASRVFGCHTGGFMEYAQAHTDVVEVGDKKMSFVLCDSMEKEYQPACYLEQSSSFESFSKEKRNYERNIGFCKQIDDDLNRMACIKLFGIRSVRIAHFKDIYDMCLNTSSVYERVMCTAVIADRIAGSTDSSRRSEAYRTIVGDVCGTLNLLNAQQCKHLVFIDADRLFYTSNADFILPGPLTLFKERNELK
ncbi:MAG: hypothetical protein AAB421_00300 [Patescibacteria group bacterium]